ncbi:MAG: outer membrane protein assembly factor BamB [Verrucomicrobiales bacterium]|jgi:outer membrane protein assembly factor BamB
MKFLAPLIFVWFTQQLLAENWPGYRGPTGMGVVEGDAELPLTWNAETGENILWKTPLPLGEDSPDHNQSSPIVHGDRVFVTTAAWAPGDDPKSTQPTHHVSCFGLMDGELIWDRVVEPGPWTLGDLRGGYAAPTPATNGKLVFATFGSSIIHALDFSGEVVWSREIPDHAQFDVALASGPIVFEDTVILLTDRKPPKSAIQAFDATTGEIRWSRKREETSFGHVTPVLAEIDGRQQLLVSATNALEGLDPKTGEVIWFSKWARSIWPVASPVMTEGLIYCMGGRGGHPGLIVDPRDAKGEIAPKFQLGPAAEGLGSPVAFGDLVFRMNKPGVLRCVRLTTGEELFEERLEGVDPGVSPVVTADGRIYIASAGKTLVLRAAGEFEVLAESDLADGSLASPAVVDGKLILKGKQFLWCVGSKP